MRRAVVGLNPGAAREKVRLARALGELPQIAAALGRGELSYGKVRALTRIATPRPRPGLLAVARAGTAAQVEQIVRGWRRVDRGADAEEATRRHQRRSLTVSHDDDGMVVVRGRLEPEAGALVLRALAAAREALGQPARGAATATPADPTGAAPTVAQRQADALALLAETALQHGLDPGPPGERDQVVVHVDAPVLADPDQPGQSVLEDGAHVPAGTSRRLAPAGWRCGTTPTPRARRRAPDPHHSPRAAAGPAPPGPASPGQSRRAAMIRDDDPGLRRRPQPPVARPRAPVKTEGGRAASAP